MSGSTLLSAAGAPLRNYVRKGSIRVIRNKQVDEIKSWNIVTGDLVYINHGRDKGKTGKVKKVIRQSNRLIVEGANLVS